MSTIVNTREAGMALYTETERQELHRQAETMNCAPYNIPPTKHAKALAAVLAGRVHALDDPVHPWQVAAEKDSPTKRILYMVDTEGCSCPYSQAHPSLGRFACYHAVAAELYDRWQHALQGLAAPSRFALPPSTEAAPSLHMAVHLHACPTCGRDWECRVLCGTLSVAKPCPTCAEGPERLSATAREDVPTAPQEPPLEADTRARLLTPETVQEPAGAPRNLQVSQVLHRPLVAPEATVEAPGGAVRGAPTTQALVPRNPLVLFAEDLATWGAQRDMIMAFIRDRLKPGIDYGPVHIVRDCESYKKRRECHTKQHWSKDSLRKPGAEKVTTLLRLRPEFVRDQETWEMLGSPIGVLCYRCLLVSPGGEIVGEGRAARDVQKQDFGDINKAIKMAEKSAQLDAVIRVAGISDVFTQDLEDLRDEEDGSPGHLAATARSTPTAGQQREAIWQLLRRHGFAGKTWEEAARVIEEWYGVRMHPDNYAGILDALQGRSAREHRLQAAGAAGQAPA